MNHLRLDHGNSFRDAPDLCRLADLPDFDTDEIIELPLLLSGGQIAALEREAHERGLTAAEMVRSVLQDFLARCRWSPDGPYQDGAF